MTHSLLVWSAAFNIFQTNCVENDQFFYLKQSAHLSKG